MSSPFQESVVFRHREANFRLSAADLGAVKRDIVRLRAELDETMAAHPEFRTSLSPLPACVDRGSLAAEMAAAARRVGDVGPMAAVAGAVAMAVARFAIERGERKVLVDNGGDLAFCAPVPVRVGVYGGERSGLGHGLALEVAARETPVAVCSSSSRMGHSKSFGDCDLALVVGESGAVADACATSAANQVRSAADVQPALERIAGIPGVHGVLIVRDGQVGLMGRRMPPLVQSAEQDLACRITGDPESVPRREPQ